MGKNKFLKSVIGCALMIVSVPGITGVVSAENFNFSLEPSANATYDYNSGATKNTTGAAKVKEATPESDIIENTFKFSVGNSNYIVVTNPVRYTGETPLLLPYDKGSGTTGTTYYLKGHVTKSSPSKVSVSGKWKP